MSTNIGDGISVGNFQSFGSTAAGSGSETTSAGIVTLQEAISFDGTPAVAVANAYVASAIINGAATVRAGSGVTAKVDSAGVTRYTPDYPRNVLVTGNTSGTAVTFTFTGYDRYGRAMTESFTGPTTATVAGKKAFASIVSIKTSATTTSAFTVGFGSVLGLSYYLTSGNYLDGTFFNGAAEVGTIVVGDATSPATATTGDAIGTYAPNGTMDGAKRVTIYQVITPTQIAAGGYFPASVFGVVPA